MHLVPVITLIAALLFLAGAGAGIWVRPLLFTGIVLAGIATAATGVSRKMWSPRLRFRPLERAYAALLAFVLLVIIPWPLAWGLPGFAQRHEQNERVVQALQTAASLGIPVRAVSFGPNGPASAFSLTRNRAGSCRAVILVVAAWSAAMLASCIPASRHVILLRFFSLLGAGMAAAGIVSILWVSQGATLWWVFPVPPVLPGPCAGFINPNHFAGYLALLAPGTLGLLLDDLAGHRRLAALLSLLSLVLMLSGVALTASLGAGIAAVAGLLATLATVGLCGRPGGLRHAAAGTLTLLGSVLSVLLLLHTPLARERLVHHRRTHRDTESLRARALTRQSAWAIWRTYPWIGAGPEAFRTTHPQHRLSSESAHMTHAENEYLQLLAETGLIGVALTIWLVTAWGWELRRRCRTERLGGAFLSPAVGTLTVAAVHAAGDFALHIPLYALTVAIWLGLLLTEPSDATAGHPTRTLRSPMLHVAGLTVLAALAPAATSLQQRDSPDHLMRADAEEVSFALVWAPTSWHAWYYLGRHACLLNTRPACEFGERCLTVAAACDPHNYRLWKELGMLRLKLGDRESARQAFERVRALRDWVKLPSLPESAP